MKNIIKKLKGKKVLSLLLALIMVLSVASPAVSIIAKAAPEVVLLNDNYIELAFDNIFIFEHWAKSPMSGNLPGSYEGDLRKDIATGSFTIKNRDTDSIRSQDFYTGYDHKTCIGYYTIPVEESTEYIFSFDVNTTGKYDAYVFYFDKDYNYLTKADGNVALDGMGQKTGSGSNISNSWPFTTPANTAYIQVRFDSDTKDVASTFSNIRICKASTVVGTTTVRQAYVKGSGKYGTLPVPTRTDDYIFGGWFTGENGTGEQITEDTIIRNESLTVYARWDKKPDSISVVKGPDKTEYSKGERINTAGIVLNAVAGSETFEITSGFTCAPEYLNKVGTQTVTVTYGGKTATFDVVVKDSVQKNILVDGKSASATVVNGKYTFSYFKDLNYYSLTYKTSSYMKGVITFGDGTSEDFYLEPSDNGNFSSYITDYFVVVSNRLTRTGINSIEFTYLDKNLGDFELLSVTATNRTRGDKYQEFNNDQFKVGINYEWGGTLSYLEDIENNPKATEDKTNGTQITLGSGSGLNLINTYDKGRYVQAAYYGTDGTNDAYEPGTYNNDPNWPYNPVQGGNQKKMNGNEVEQGYNAASKVVDFKITRDPETDQVSEIYVKTQPLDWAKHKDDITPSYMETTYVFEHGMIKAYCRFIDFSGYNHNAEKRQEIPAFYPIEPLNTFVYYDGGVAWSSSNQKKTIATDGTVTATANDGDLDFDNSKKYPTDFLNINENWAAFVNDKDYGIGIYSSRADGFSVGVYRPATKDTKKSIDDNPSDDDPTSYITPFATYKMESFKAEESSYYITTGSAEEIRSDFEKVANPNYADKFGKGLIAVPEAVYLTPSKDSSTTGQYYVNNTMNSTDYSISLDASNNAEKGKLQFYIPGAESVTCSVSGATVKRGTEPEMTVLTLSPDVNDYFAATDITMKLSSGLSAGNSTVVEWKFTATMEDGSEKIHYAYTTFYAPYYQPVGAATESYSGKGISNSWQAWAGSILWVEGVHGFDTSSSNVNEQGFNLKQPNSSMFNPMINGTVSVVNNTRPYKSGETNHWLVDSGGAPDKTMSYNEGSGSNHRRTSVVSPLVKLTVDTSRYGNFSQIPNFKVGFLITDSEYTDSGKHYVADYTGYTTNLSHNGEGGSNRSSIGDSIYNTTTGTKLTEKSSKDCLLHYHGVWNRAVATGRVQLVSAMGADETNGTQDRSAWSFNYVIMDVTGVYKAELRDLVLQATAIDETKEYTSDSWGTFKSAFSAASHVLGDPDVTAAEVTTATTNLKNAINGLQTVVKVYENKGTDDTTATDVYVNVAKVDENLIVTLDSVAIFSPTVPTRTGYELASWNSRALGTGTDYGKGEITVPFNSTIYAQWKPVQYKVTYNPNGGTMGTTAKTYTIEDTFALETATKPYYTLAGWKVTGTDGDWSGTYTADAAISGRYGNVTLTAQWEGNPYTINFNSNGGSGSMANQNMVYGTESTLNTNQFTKTGYKFSSWNTAADGSGTSYTDNQTVKDLATSGTVTLYAQWVENVYFINFNSNGASGTMDDVKVAIGSSYNLPVNGFTKTGYSFAGWSETADGAVIYSDKASVKDLAEIGEKITLYAQWTVNNYKIVFNANGGSGTMTEIETPYTTTQLIPKNGFTRPGWIFTGWNTESDGSGTAYAVNDSVAELASKDKNNEVVTLYAQWKEIKYTVNYDNLIDLGQWKTGGVVSKSIVEFSDIGITLTSTARGEEREGTYTSHMFPVTAGESYKIEADITDLTGDGWDVYIFFYNDQVNSGLGINFNDTLNRYSSNGSGNADHIFTAPGGATKACIRLDANGVNKGTVRFDNIRVSDVEISVDPVRETVDYNGKLSSLPTPTRKGYTFEGWYKDTACTTPFSVTEVFDESLSADETVNLYSKWSENTYSVYYSANGPELTELMGDSYKYESGQFTLQNPTEWITAWAAYGEFIGWSAYHDADPYSTKDILEPGTIVSLSNLPEEAFEDKINADGTIEHQVILKAIWKLKEPCFVEDVDSVDFGLPVKVDTLINDNPVVKYHFSLAEKFDYGVQSSQNTTGYNKTASGTYGDFSFGTEGDDKYRVIYTPNKIMNGVEEATFVGYYQYKDGNVHQFSSPLTFVPASNMYYEETVLTQGSTGKVGWSTVGTAGTNQVTGGVYGYDEAYNVANTYSNGSALTATVDSTNKRSETATFTFTGTGFDLVSACGPNTGVQIVQIKELKKVFIVDTFYADNTFTQVPIVNWSGAHGTYTVEATAAYLSTAGALKSSSIKQNLIDTGLVMNSAQTKNTADIDALLASAGIEDVSAEDVELIWFDDNSILNGGTGVALTKTGSRESTGTNTAKKLVNYIDGVRIYNPLDYTSDDYKENDYYSETEKNPVYVNVTNNLATVTDGVPSFGDGSAFTVGDLKADETTGKTPTLSFANYQSVGPKGEFYMNASGTLSFNVKLNAGERVMLGLRAVNGATKCTITSSSNIAFDVNSATEMYYDITEQLGTISDGTTVMVTISNSGSNLLAINHVKFSGAEKSGVTVPAGSARSISRSGDTATEVTENKFLPLTADDLVEIQENLAKETVPGIVVGGVVKAVYADAPEVDDTETTEPEGGNTDVTEPEGGNTDVTEPEGGNTDVTEPEGGNTDVTEPEGGNTETTEPEGGNTDVTEPEEDNTETTEPEDDNTETTEPEDDNNNNSGSSSGSSSSSGITGALSGLIKFFEFIKNVLSSLFGIQ